MSLKGLGQTGAGHTCWPARRSTWATPATRAQETNAWLEEYLLEKPPREEDEWEKAAEAKQPFILHGKVHIFMDDFRKWLDINIGEQITAHALGRRLKQCQARTEKVNVKIGKLTGPPAPPGNCPRDIHAKRVPEEPES